MSLNLENKKYYSIRQVYLNRFFPWIYSYSALKNWIQNDIKTGNKVFKTIVIGTKSGVRYRVPGEQIIAILEKANKGEPVQ